MPKQETYFSQRADDNLVEVIKSYDPSYAREVFQNVNEEALKQLASALQIEQKYDPSDLPEVNTPEYEDLLWGEMVDSSVEDMRQSPRLQSFFVVSQTRAGKTETIYVSPDWPSAEEFARKLLPNS